VELQKYHQGKMDFILLQMQKTKHVNYGILENLVNLIQENPQKPFILITEVNVYQMIMLIKLKDLLNNNTMIIVFIVFMDIVYLEL